MSGGGKGGAVQNIGVNPMTNAANGMQGAFQALQGAAGQIGQQQAQGYSPVTGQAQQYSPSQMQASGYNAAQGAAQGYNAAQMQGVGYGAQQQQSPEDIRALMGNYQNPYETEVVDRTTANMQRTTQMQQEQNAAAASAAGAFGGGRHGVVEAMTNAEGQRNIGDMTAQLRQQGFDTAAGLAGQDISNRMSVRGQNQQAENAARQFTAGNQQQAGMANMDARNQASQFGADAGNMMSQFNTAAQNAQRQYNAGNQQQAGMANMDARNTAGQFNANNRQDMSQFNAGARNEGAQYNAAARERTQGSRVQDLMSLAQGLGGLSQQSFGMGNTLTQQQVAAGAQQQALLQSILGGSGALFDQYMSNPQQLLQMRLAAAGMSPLNGATTTTGTQQTPNTLPGNLLGAAGNMFQFAPIALSSERFKHDVRSTGRMVLSNDGNMVPEVTFRYKEDIDPQQTCYTGIVAEHLPVGDSAVVAKDGRHHAIDYSKLEIVA